MGRDLNVGRHKWFADTSREPSYIVQAIGVATGGFWGLQLPIEPRMASYILLFLIFVSKW